MKKILLVSSIMIFSVTIASAQSNKIVFGPLEGDDAGVLTVHNAEDFEIEMWVRTNPDNQVVVLGIIHGLMSEDAIIAVRDGAEIDPYYDEPNWESIWIDGPYTHDPADDYPIPQGYTCEMQAALWCVFDPCFNPLDTQGEWDYYGAFLMTSNSDVPIDDTYYPFSRGWYPHSGQGTSWAFETPPGGSVEPEQDYCGLYFERETGTGENQNLPEEFSLAQNHPNPFNATTTIQYYLPEESNVAIEIYNILGRKIETLMSGIQPAGRHSMVWDADNQPSGIYFYRINAGPHDESKSCLLLK